MGVIIVMNGMVDIEHAAGHSGINIDLQEAVQCCDLDWDRSTEITWCLALYLDVISPLKIAPPSRASCYFQGYIYTYREGIIFR